MINKLIESSFLIFPFAASSEAELIEVVLTVATTVSIKLRTIMNSTIPDNKIIYEQFYMGVNFILRYSVGGRRLKDAVKKRGPAFFVRYNETLPRVLQTKITKFIRNLVENSENASPTHQKQLNMLFKSISFMGRNVNLEQENGFKDIFDLPDDFNPLFFTQIYAKQRYAKGFSNIYSKMLIIIYFLKCL
jgi:hypothetical protein